MSDESGKKRGRARDRRKAPPAETAAGGDIRPEACSESRAESCSESCSESGSESWAIIRRLMSDRGWILQELIRRSGITRTTFFNIQHGKSKGSYETYVKIAKAFGVEVDVLFGRAPYPEGIRDGFGFAGTLPESQRSIRVGSVSYIRVPVVKSVRHDEPPDIAENIVETMFLSTANASPDDFFLLVEGDEMAPQIGRGDTVHVRRNAVVRSGDIVCVAFADGTPGVVRHYRTVGETHEFSSPGERHNAVRLREKEFVLFGKVVKVIRPL